MFNETARKLAAAFWPGALTLVLPPHRELPLSQLVSAGLDTVALRVPAHPSRQRCSPRPASRSRRPAPIPPGRISATTAAHVRESLGDKVDLILDGGATPLGLESTVIGFEGGQPVLLRPGAIARDEIEDDRRTAPRAGEHDNTVARPARQPLCAARARCG